jgi:hypothetical protein
MFKRLFVLLAAGAVVSISTPGARYADGVVDYQPGVGFATEFGSGLGYTNALAALGEPSRVTPGLFGGPVDPFNPPYLREQLVSMGAGGSITLQFATPVFNSPGSPFGLDFIIFGSAGFVITNGNYTGGGITDGSLFGDNPGVTRVSVSADNQSYFTLDPTRAPPVDSLFPTDGLGDFAFPVNPALSNLDFAGLNLEAIRERYAGSAGGAGYDIAWAMDNEGRTVDLPGIRFIRVEVLEGAVEIDGISVVPEPSTWALTALGIGLIVARRRIRAWRR